MTEDEYFMQAALALAKDAAVKQEVPVGAVLVYQHEIVSSGSNQSIHCHDATAHAEIQALREAGKFFKNYRLLETTLYVTLEPCAMCYGAMVHARIKRLVFGAFDLKSGGVGSAMALHEQKHFNHRIAVQGGVLELSCSRVLKDFFKEKRESG